MHSEFNRKMLIRDIEVLDLAYVSNSDLLTASKLNAMIKAIRFLMERQGFNYK